MQDLSLPNHIYPSLPFRLKLPKRLFKPSLNPPLELLRPSPPPSMLPRDKRPSLSGYGLWPRYPLLVDCPSETLTLLLLTLTPVSFLDLVELADPLRLILLLPVGPIS